MEAIHHHHSLIIALTGALLCAAPGALGRQLDAPEALAAATCRIPGGAGLHTSAMPQAAFPLAVDSVIRSTAGDNLIYIANAPGGAGFVIAAADDCFPCPLVGYSPAGTFSYADAPEGARAFVDACAEQVRLAIESGALLTPAVTPAHRSTPVPNFLEAIWDQSYPYNESAPSVSGTKCYTGCVATAMAQVMRHYRHPAQGTGSHSYSWGSETLSADFGNTTYDWDHMPATYSYSWTTADLQAVATLMYHCGVSVEMMYGRSASAANVYNVPGALATYFGYDDGMKLHLRRSCTTDSWAQLVYDEMAAGRPVLYSGSDTSAGGHYFICSGCDGDDNFYINWGWSGSCNGYFKLGALNAGGYAFNSDQCILTGIQPDDGEESPDRFRITGLGNLALYYKQYGVEYKRGNSTEYVMPTSSSSFYGFYNYHWEAVTPVLGVIFEDVSTGTETVAEAYSFTPKALGMGECHRSFQVHHSAFPQSGTHRMYPAAQDSEGTWHRIAMEASSPQYILVDCTPTTLTYSIDSEGLPSLQSSFTNPGKLPLGSLALTVPVENAGTGEYNGAITLRTKISSASYWTQQQKAILLQPGESATVTFTLPSSSTAGVYAAYISDDTGKKIVDNFEFTVYDPNALELQFAGMPTLTLDDPAISAPEGEISLRLTVPVTCTEGLYEGTPRIAVWDMGDGYGSLVKEIDAEASATIVAGQSATLTFSGAIPHKKGDYLIDIYYDGQTYIEEPAEYAAPLSFALADPVPTSLTTAEAEVMARRSTVYDLSGTAVTDGGTASLRPGLYIVVPPGAPARKIIIRP